MPGSRAHVLRIRLATGTAAVIDFNLDPGTRLTHVSVDIGAAGPPLKVAVSIIQPRVQAAFGNALVGGWVRGSGVQPALSGALTWDGDLEIGTDMAIRFRVRNDTGATHGPIAAFMVVE